MRKLLKVIRALSDETRIRIVKVLLERDCCVCEVMQALDISQSRASRNLSILEEVGFINSTREGIWVVYSINNDGDDCVDYLLKMMRTCLKNNETIELDRERLTKAIREYCKEMKNKNKSNYSVVR
jgi:ArsR family transcriptional regulator, arsenate/arsenite/antimonite-responsive transcriptional repressor